MGAWVLVSGIWYYDSLAAPHDGAAVLFRALAAAAAPIRQRTAAEWAQEDPLVALARNGSVRPSPAGLSSRTASTIGSKAPPYMWMVLR